jgi:hypothetical protein
MPGDYYIDSSCVVIFTTLYDTVTDNEVLDIQQRVATDPNFNPDFHHLYDLRQDTAFEVFTRTIQRPASVKLLSEHSRRVIVTPYNSVYGMARMYEAYHNAGPGQIWIFRSPEEACAWLGIQHTSYCRWEQFPYSQDQQTGGSD